MSINSTSPVSLRNFLNIIFKWKKTIFAVFITIVLTITSGSFLLTPIFRSTSKVMFTPSSDNEFAILFGVSLRSSYRYGYDGITSEIEILTCRPVIERVIRKLGMDEKLFQEKKITEEKKKRLAMEKMVENFQKAIIIKRISGSDVLSISYESNSPEMAKEVVNTLVDIYVEYREEIYSADSEYAFYNNQIEVTGQQLNHLEQRLATFKQGQGMPAPELQTQIVLAKVADYEKTISEVRRNRISRESTLAVLEVRTDSIIRTTIPSTHISDSPSRERYIATLRGELLNLELQRSRLLQKFTPEYPEIKNLDAEIIATETRIKKEVEEIIREERIAIDALKAEEEVLQQKIEELNEQLRQLSKLEYEMGKISRGINDNREIYSMLLKQREQSKITMAKNKSLIPVKIISRAQESLQPVRPNYKLNFIFALLFGLVLAIGLAFILEHFTHTVDTPEDVEKYLGYQTLASVNFEHDHKGLTEMEVMN